MLLTWLKMVFVEHIWEQEQIWFCSCLMPSKNTKHLDVYLVSVYSSQGSVQAPSKFRSLVKLMHLLVKLHLSDREDHDRSVLNTTDDAPFALRKWTSYATKITYHKFEWRWLIWIFFFSQMKTSYMHIWLPSSPIHADLNRCWNEEGSTVSRCKTCFQRRAQNKTENQPVGFIWLYDQFH